MKWNEFGGEGNYGWVTIIKNESLWVPVNFTAVGKLYTHNPNVTGFLRTVGNFALAKLKIYGHMRIKRQKTYMT